MSDTDNIRLAFLHIELFENGNTIQGGLLITDIETKPYEFRVTSPVRPTPLQRILYGNTLDDYVHIDLIGTPLIGKAKEKLSLILVLSPLLLRLRPKVSFPTVLIKHDTKENLSAGNDNSIAPIVIIAHRDFQGEAPAARAMLSGIMQKRDLLEPFERLKIAVSQAHKEKVGEATK